MVVIRRPHPVAAVIVPDSGAWAMWGRDLPALGFAQAHAPEQADLLIGPERVPEGLAAAVRAAWRLLPEPGRHVALAGPLRHGPALAGVVGSPDEPAGADDGDPEHGGDDDGDDPMAITGDPSADGLVMEAAELELGPLCSPLPGGLRARISLDGDVVASCVVEPLLRAPAGAAAPDPLAPAAWGAAFAVARGAATGWGDRLAAVERERALSHLVWLWGLGTVLGWPELAEASYGAVRPLLAREWAAAARPAERVAGLLDGSRRLRVRTRGVAVLTAQEAAERGLAGPTARAAGAPGDARDDEPAYAAAGFDAVRGADGDAEARVLARASEAVAALALASRLAGEEPPAPSRIEGPRGPVAVRLAPVGRPVVLEAAGTGAAAAVAGEAAVGLEWSRALVALASFDLSPWLVPG